MAWKIQAAALLLFLHIYIDSSIEVKSQSNTYSKRRNEPPTAAFKHSIFFQILKNVLLFISFKRKILTKIEFPEAKTNFWRSVLTVE